MSESTEITKPDQLAGGVRAPMPQPEALKPGMKQKVIAGLKNNRLVLKASVLLNRLPPRSKKILMITAVVFLLFILLVFILALASSRKRLAPEATPTPTPTGFTPIDGEITSPSRYASDAGVLKIEADLKSLDERMSSEKVREEDLNLPQLDFNVSF